MESTINERIYQYIKQRVGYIRNMADALGINEITLANKLRGNRRVNIELVVKMLSVYEELSPDWLLLGRGPMLRNPQVSNNVNGDINGDNIQGERVSVRKGDSHLVELLQKQLDEEKQRSKEYWNTIQKLINK